MNNSTIKIFLFHRVHPVRDRLWDPMDPILFDYILAQLNKRYCIVKIEDAFTQPDFHNSIFKKPLAAIVFDDGYKDFLDYAAPLLHKHKTPASMYVVTGCVYSGLPPWTYILDYSFAHTRILGLDLAEWPELMNLGKSQWVNSEEKMRFVKKLKPQLKGFSNEKRLKFLRFLSFSFSDVELPTNLMMNWDEIREIDGAGFEVGSHTVSHPLLSKISNEEEIRKELDGSREAIHFELKKFPITISYPIGSFDNRVTKIAKQVGYKVGLAVEQIAYRTNVHDRFAVPRIELYNESVFKTELRINGLITKFKNILGR